MNVQTFRKKPVEIKAVQLADDNFDEVLEWVQGYTQAHIEDVNGVRFIILLGHGWAQAGDWISEWDAKPEHLEVRRAGDFEATFEAVRPGGEPA